MSKQPSFAAIVFLAAAAVSPTPALAGDVRMSTQLMSELQNTERELVDALQTMKRAATPDQFDGQINSMMNNNLMFLSLQTKVQNVSRTTQLMSNIAKTDSDAKLNSIRNLRN